MGTLALISFSFLVINCRGEAGGVGFRTHVAVGSKFPLNSKMGPTVLLIIFLRSIYISGLVGDEGISPRIPRQKALENGEARVQWTKGALKKE